VPLPASARFGPPCPPARPGHSSASRSRPSTDPCLAQRRAPHAPHRPGLRQLLGPSGTVIALAPPPAPTLNGMPRHDAPLRHSHSGWQQESQQGQRFPWPPADARQHGAAAARRRAHQLRPVRAERIGDAVSILAQGGHRPQRQPVSVEGTRQRTWANRRARRYRAQAPQRAQWPGSERGDGGSRNRGERSDTPEEVLQLLRERMALASSGWASNSFLMASLTRASVHSRLGRDLRSRDSRVATWMLPGPSGP